MNRRHALPAAIALVLTLSGCGLFGKDKPLQVKSPDDVKAEIAAVLQQILDDATPGTTRKDNGVSIAPCGDGDANPDGRFDAVSSWVLFPPEQQTVPMIDAMPDKWKAHGWTILENGMLNDKVRRLRAETPNHYGIIISDNTNGTAGVLISSDCYRPPNPDMVHF
ncbi:hypothetical protein AB0M46_47980 [Dactylosporangium sp. NPDC051485]|uniref:hypothetical protein n=1 Tax=Dactylosporangium sp. NPDC051485 TaxID=3154846 RepID=UPI0034341BEF